MMKPVVAALSFGVLVFVVGGAAKASPPALADPTPEAYAHGQEIFTRCQACHSLTRNRTGPRLCGVVGRPAGAVPGFRYSGAMLASGLVWDEKKLLSFIEDPRGTVPGTFMGYAGVKDFDERKALLAFLVGAASTAGCEE